MARNDKFSREVENKKLVVSYFVCVVVAFSLSFFIVNVIAKIPTQGKLASSINVNPFVAFSIFGSLMLWYLLWKMGRSHIKVIPHLAIIALSTLTVYSVQHLGQGAVVYDSRILDTLSFVVSSAAILLFQENVVGKLKSDVMVRAAIFSSGTLWFTPLIVELWLYAVDPRVQGYTLGADGLADVLFLYGFLCLLMVYLYYRLRRVIFSV